MYETSADELEAWSEARREVDMEMAEMTIAADHSEALRRAGICQHNGVVGYRSPRAFPGQEALRPGQLRCTERTNGCERVFDSDEDWYAAMDEAAER
jgi:hypothetical protein